MTITCNDLKFFASERMTDNEDGGGQMTATEIISGEENQIFDDLSDVDRAAGDVSIRKIFAAVTSADTAKYLDAGVVLFAPPADESMSVLLFSTGSGYDERDALKARLEQTISRGPRWQGWLWGQHLPGQRALVLWQRPEATLPQQGQRLELVSRTGGADAYSDVIWVTRVTDSLMSVTAAEGNTTATFTVRQVVCELAEALTQSFNGTDPTRVDPSTGTAPSLIYDTRYNAEAVPLYGTMPLVDPAEVGDYSLRIGGLYAPVIPTALSETAIPDANPAGDSAVLVAGNDAAISFSTATQCIKPGVSLWLGTGCKPGSLSISVSGATLTDSNGDALLGELVIGAIDYGAGLVRWNDDCPNYGSASKSVQFIPATRPLQEAETAADLVTAENRGYVWTITLDPIPLPGSLRVSYRVNNRWYQISDQGGGLLSGADSSYGAGQLNFGTGTVTWTAGALPDVDSEIIYAWGTPALYAARGGDAVEAPVIRGQTEHEGVAPGTFEIDGTGIDLADDGHGAITGTGGVGEINYDTGEWWVRPSTLPDPGLELTVHYDWGAPTETVITDPARQPGGTLLLDLETANLRPDTVRVSWPVAVDDVEVLSTNPDWMHLFSGGLSRTIRAQDDGAGVLDIPSGTDGEVAYVAGTLEFLPDVTVSIPVAKYRVRGEGWMETPTGKVRVYRQQFIGFEYHDAAALYTSGDVTVRYRVAGGDTAAEETVTVDQLELDLTHGYSETIAVGSVRFLLGGSTYVDTAGRIYRDPAPDTGAGTLCGSLDPTTGRVRLSSWAAGGANAVTLQSLVTRFEARPVEEVVFRTPTAPIRGGSLQLRWTNLKGEAKSKQIDSGGALEDADALITVDHQLGVVRARFGLWRLDSALDPEEKEQPWYDPDSLVEIDGEDYIWYPKPALSGSIVYNAVAQTFLPPDSAMLGINAARLPPDGRALIYNAGRLVLVHHTDSLSQLTLSPGEVIDCGRTRLYRVVIEDAGGIRLPADAFTVNRELGMVTMSLTLDLDGFSAPYAVRHTVADLARLVSVDISGVMTLQRPLSHDYPEDETLVSGVLFIGTLQARYTDLFAQSTWTGVWSDVLQGSEPLAQYNDTLYPIQVANAGAYPDRYLVRFTSSSEFQVIGEQLGLIGIGSINTDCTPINALTGNAFFTLDHRGWGTGWSQGNCVRFNVLGACYPVDLVRATQPSQPTGQADACELLLIGNVDA